MPPSSMPPSMPPGEVSLLKTSHISGGGVKTWGLEVRGRRGGLKSDIAQTQSLSGYISFPYPSPLPRITGKDMTPMSIRANREEPIRRGLTAVHANLSAKGASGDALQQSRLANSPLLIYIYA